MATETDLPTLQKLCFLIAQQWKAELAYHRAQYRVSYYRKLKAKLETSKKPNEKWDDHIELAKKIEAERLNTLQKQEQLLKTQRKLKSPIEKAVKTLGAKLTYSSGERKVVAIYLPTEDKKWKNVNATQIAEYADQHEAETALTRALSK